MMRGAYLALWPNGSFSLTAITGSGSNRLRSSGAQTRWPLAKAGLTRRRSKR